MTIKLMRTRDLFWKEWRTRRWTLISLAGLMVIAYQIAQLQNQTGLPDPYFAFLLPLAAAILGVDFFSREELIESRSFLHTLPLSRGQIFRIKLTAGLTQLALFMALGLLLAIPSLLNLAVNNDKEFQEVLWYIATAAPMLTVLYFSCAIALYHMRRSLTAFIIGSAAAVLFVGLLFIEPNLANPPYPASQGIKPTVWSWGWLVQDVVAAVLLGGWLGILYCRTPLAEQTATARFLLWVLWAVAFLELFVFLFFTGWRDLFYLLTGV